jgi:hypothetical protein
MTKLFAVLMAGALLLLALPAFAGEFTESLMTSAPWCTYVYSPGNGQTNASRTVYKADGTFEFTGKVRGVFWAKGGMSDATHETYSTGRWKVVDGELYLDQKNNGKFHPVYLSVQKDDQGNPILVSGRTTYTHCK